MKFNFNTALCLLLLEFGWAFSTDVNASATLPSVSPTIHYRLGCSIYDSTAQLIKAFDGKLCAFYEDGSYLAYLPQKNLLRKLSKDGRMLWERSVFVHGQIKVSRDQKKILLIGGEVRRNPYCKVRFDEISILSSEDGTILKKTSGPKFYQKLFSTARDMLLSVIPEELREGIDADCEYSPMVSVAELPDARIVVGFPNLCAYGLFDKNLENFEYHYLDNDFCDLYDLQSLQNGNLLFYLKAHKESPAYTQNSGSVVILNPKDDKIVSKFSADDPCIFPTDIRYGMGVQAVDDAILVSSRCGNEAKLYSLPLAQASTNGNTYKLILNIKDPKSRDVLKQFNWQIHD